MRPFLKLRSVALLMVCASISDAQTENQSRLIVNRTISGAQHDMTRVHWAIALTDERLLVSQWQDHRALIFDKDDRSYSALGRAGAGPGEFGSMKIGPNVSQFIGGVQRDTLWFYDRNLRRFTWMLPGKGVVRTTPLPLALSASLEAWKSRANAAGETLIQFEPKGITPGGEVVGIATFGALRKVRDELIPLVARQAVVRVNLATAKFAAIAILPLDSSQAVIEMNSGLRQFGAPVPYRVPPTIAVSADGSRMSTVVIDHAKPHVELTVYETSRYSVVYTRQLPLRAAQLSATSADSVIRVVINAFPKVGRGALTPANRDELLRRLREMVPRYRVPTPQVVLARDGFVWVALGRDGANRELQLLDPAGAAAFTGQLPAEVRLLDGTQSFIWVREADQDDLDLLHRYVIRAK